MRCLYLTFLVCAGCSLNDDVPAPLASSITPDHAPPGAVVSIDGDYFCQRPETGQEDPTCDTTGTVEFGQTPATPTTWSDVEIMVEVPEGGSGDVSVTVTAMGRTSSSLDFTID